MARKAGVVGAIALGALSLVGCDVQPPEGLSKALAMGWPNPVTPEGHEMYNFWIWVWVAAWIIGIIMWGLMITAIVSWGRKRQEKKGAGEFPKQLQYNVPLELVLTFIPIVIVMVLFFFTAETQQKVVAMDKNPEVTVDVTAYQWNWKFGYQKTGANFGPNGAEYDGRDQARQAKAEATAHDPEGTDNPNPIHGKSTGDLSYLHYNKIETTGTTEEVPVLVLPANTSVEFQLASADVNHSFWVPAFLFKRDAYAHPESNQQQRAFQIQSIEEGAYVGRCTEMCGTYHAMMNFEVRVVSKDAFKEYMKFRNANPQAPNSEALKHIGQEPYATATKPFVTQRDGTRDGNNVNQPQNA